MSPLVAGFVGSVVFGTAAWLVNRSAQRKGRSLGFWDGTTHGLVFWVTLLLAALCLCVLIAAIVRSDF